MDVEWLKEWTEVLSAGITLLAVLVALSIGVASILHTQSMQKRERRERLLNEIIEWAIDAGRCGLERDLPNPASITDMNDAKLQLAVSANMLSLSFQSMGSRNEYIHAVTSAFGQDLREAGDTLIRSLEEHMKLLNNVIDISTFQFRFVTDANKAEYISKIDEATTQVARNRIKLDELVNKVIEKTTEIKNRDIS